MALVISALVALPVAAPMPVGAVTQSEIGATETQVATIENTIATEQQQGAELDAQYVAAQAKVAQIATELADTQHLVVKIQAHVKVDRARLAQDAVSAYIYDQPIGQLDSLFDTSVAGSSARTQYEDAAVGNATVAVDALDTEQDKLTATARLEQDEQTQAAAAANQVHTLQLANQQAAAQATATLDQVRGQLATQVAQYAVQQAEAQAALAASNPASASTAAPSATEDAAVAVSVGGADATQAVAAANQAAAAAGAPPAAGTGVGSGQGSVAVAAAESQLGVPYVWGGESPGVGFDCSGLTQWSWRQAGVSIPRVAADQSSAIPAVPLTALEPGDLLFYYNLDGDDEIDHVVMYVGSGPYGTQTIIQAPYTGTVVQYAPLFTEGLVGAGRP